MKILFLTNFSLSLPPQLLGGARFLANICKEMNLQGNKVDVLSMADRKSESPQTKIPYRVINCKEMTRFSSLLSILKCLQLCKNRYDLFFIGILMTTNAIGMYLISRLFGTPLVLLLHGFDMDYLKSRFFIDRFLARLYLKKASLILVNSTATGQRAVLNGAEPSKIKVLNPGVDTDFFYKRNNLKTYLDKHGLNGKRVVLTVSRLVRRKGHKYVIEAIAELKKEIPDIHYLVIGEGSEYGELIKLTHELGVAGEVSFIGSVQDDELPNYYSLSEVFVMPTFSDGNDYEGFGMVYLEANACGIPVIGSRTGGVADAIVDGKTGILVSEKDISGLSKAIRLLLVDNALRAKMGDVGRKRVQTHFSWKAVGNRLEDYLRECLAMN